MTAYYNEFDPKAAAWLRELIKQGHIADGVVDERSIEDVTPNDLKGFTQCHFFAGIGVWSYALRRAGWADDRPVWTGSCPCQPFSAAGKGTGFADERHLWPAFHHLISQCRPDTVLGEQVASKDGLNWLDLVCADLEAANYAAGAVDLCAAGVGAPHIRQRLWWVGTRLADAMRIGQSGQGIMGRPSNPETEGDWQEHRVVNAGGCRVLGNAPSAGLEGAAGASIQGSVERPSHAGDHGGMADARRAQRLWGQDTSGFAESEAEQWEQNPSNDKPCGSDGGMADADSDGRSAGERDDQAARHGHPAASTGNNGGMADAAGRGQLDALNGSQRGQGVEQIKLARGSINVQLQRPSPTNGFWGSADWLFCRDGKWRPVEPGTFPLAHGAPSRVGRLRGYGNAINAEAAQAFIESVK